LVDKEAIARKRNLPLTIHLTFQKHLVPALALLLALLLYGCGGATPQPEPQPPEATRTPAATNTPQVRRTPTLEPTATAVSLPTLEVDENDLRGISIDFWHIHGFLLEASGGGDTLQTLVDEFNRTNRWGISVRNRSFNDYEEIFNTIQSSIYGDLPDVVLGYNYQAASLYRSGELLLDLSPYLDDPRYGLSPDEIADFLPVFWQQERDGSARLGLPFYRSAQVLLYNQSWAQELGFRAPPVTADEFKEQACAAALAAVGREDGPARAGGWAIDTSAPTLAAWIYAFQGSLERPGERGYTFDGQGTLEAFHFLRQMYDEGCAWITGSPYPNREFASRQALFISSSVGGLSHQQSAMVASGSSDNWMVIPFPSLEGDPVILAYGPSLALLRGEAEQELAAWLFAKWLTSPDVQAEWTRSQGTLPVRASVLEELDDYRQDQPQWGAAIELLPYARVEPGRPSWSLVHFVLSDAGRYLFSPLVTTRQVPEIIETLEQTAAELDGQFR
jgi:multiple sugar transport system substrate-binding protein